MKKMLKLFATLVLIFAVTSCSDLTKEPKKENLLPVHEHEFSTELSYDENFHWYAATCGHDVDVIEKKAHNFNFGVCKDCNYISKERYHIRGNVEIENGCFFSHDPGKFPVEMVRANSVILGTEVFDFDKSKISFEDSVNGGTTPMESYRLEEKSYTYTLNVFYNGLPLYYEDETRVTVKAYIGIKGDADLDNDVDASDATNTLAYYANVTTGQDAFLYEGNNELDNLCCFLADIEKDCFTKDNWKTQKSERVIDSNDASLLLTYYAKIMTTDDLSPFEIWVETIGAEYETAYNNYKNYGTLID